MVKTPLNIALIGAGLIGLRHLRVLSENSDYRVAGIVDPSDKVKTLCQERGVPHFKTTENLLAQIKPDGVIVAVPNQMHVSVGALCLNAGIPVLMEKPLADTLAGAAKLTALSVRVAVPLAVAHHRRHNPFMQEARDMITRGQIGRLIGVNGLWLTDKPDDYFNIPWHRELGAGPVLINAIHDIDNLRMLMGEIETVQAFADHSVRNHPVEETAAFILRFESGALGAMLFSDAVPSPFGWEKTVPENPFHPQSGHPCYVIGGTKGTLSVPTLELNLREPGDRWDTKVTTHLSQITPVDAYAAQMQNFADVIRGHAMPVVTAEDGFRTLATAHAILDAAQSARAINVTSKIESALCIADCENI